MAQKPLKLIGLPMCLIRTLLTISTRGSLKLGTSILVIAIFTALLIAMNTMSHSFLAQTPFLNDLGKSNVISISQESLGGSIPLTAFTQRIGEEFVVFLSSSDLNALVKALKIKYDGTLPSFDQALAGRGLAPLISNGQITFSSHVLKVSGTIKSPSHLLRAVIVPFDAVKALEVENTIQLYLTDQTTSSAIVSAPALQGLVYGVIGESLLYMSSITFLLYVLLGVASSVQGYASMVESVSTLRVFSVLGVSEKIMALSLATFSMILSAISTLFGFSLGMVASAGVSSAASLLLGLPHIKPLVEWNIAQVLFTSFATASAALAIGLIGGYMRSLDAN